MKFMSEKPLKCKSNFIGLIQLEKFSAHSSTATNDKNAFCSVGLINNSIDCIFNVEFYFQAQSKSNRYKTKLLGSR